MSRCASASKTRRATPRECARRRAARATCPRSPRPRPPDAAMRPGAARPSGWRPRSYVEISRARTTSLFHVILADDAADLFGGAPRHRILRPPARALHALLHGDVGALQLLRHARLPHPLHGGAAATAGGLGFSDADAASIYGTYTASAWGLAILGGIVADRFLGQYRSVLIGGIIIALGHFTLAFPPVPFFYAGLALVAIGTGLLKPNVSTLVGSLYEQADARRDAGFSLFYMGINIGAIAGPLIAGYLAQRVDWHIGFGCAGVGMALGLIAVRARQEAAPARARSARGPAEAAIARLGPRRRRRLVGFSASRGTNGNASARSSSSFSWPRCSGAHTSSRDRH